MKTKIIFLGLAIVAITMVSCKKEYTCSCDKIYTTATGNETVEDGSYILKDNEARAADQCNKQESTGTDSRGDFSRQCDI